MNRFAGTWSQAIRVPLPEHYVLGFDDQLWDVEAGGFYKYLRGELRGPDKKGWWYYYLYGLLVKLPLGTLALICFATLLLIGSYVRHLRTRAASATVCPRCGLVTELALLLPPLAVIGSLSLETGMNSHVRYVLPALPFLFVFAGRIAAWCLSGRRWRAALVVVLMVMNAVSVLHVHPHYLAYFNEAVGGPRSGIRHLADSNLDWGQGLIALREWIDEHAPGQPVQLAYFGMMHPEDAGIDYEWLDARNPRPGLQAVGATLLVGIPRFVNTGRGSMAWNDDAFREYRKLEPIATPGYSMYVFELSTEDVERLRARARSSSP